MTSDAPMIECRNLRRTFQRGGPLRRGSEIVAVSDISFDVRPGTIFGLLGPNGAGKTTTVRMLSTLLLPTEGSARVAGFNVASQPREVRRRTGLALGGDRGLFGRLTGEQNMQYFGAINHLSPREANRRSTELLELVGLGERRGSKVFEYSRGMKQRLHLARALLTEPDVLFLDEPTSGLDPLGAFEFRQLVGELKERGRTILLTTHFMLEADELCDELIVIDRGVVVAQGSPATIKRQFGSATVVEISLREPQEGLDAALGELPQVQHVEVGVDGMLQTVRVHIPSDQDAGPIVAHIGAEHVDHMTTRTSSLEEAYLTLIGREQ